MTLEKLKDASCSDGDCVFKITPEMKKGMRTNGGCSCLKDMRHGIGSRKTYAVMVLSQIASDAEAALAAKDARIKELKDAFRTGRDSTATGYSDYHVGMANGIEWALSCLELREPKYFECGRKEPLLDMRELEVK